MTPHHCIHDCNIQNRVCLQTFQVQLYFDGTESRTFVTARFSTLSLRSVGLFIEIDDVPRSSCYSPLVSSQVLLPDDVAFPFPVSFKNKTNVELKNEAFM